MVALREVVDFYSGGTPSKSTPEFWQGDVPWFSAKDFKRPRLSDSTDHVAEAVFDSTPLRKLPAGTVAMVVRGMILAHTVPIAVLDVDAAVNQDVKALLPKRNLHPSFLAAMLRAQHSTILAQVGTAAHGTKKLDSRVLESLEIPLPPLAEQRRIAAILDHADALRAKRRQVLAHLDVLTQSIFHDMFGDPDRAADDIPLGAVAGLAGGRNLVAGDSKATSDYRVLKISAVTTGQFKPWESKPLPHGYVPPKNHLVRAGDLLMSRANTAELVGAVALVDSAPANLALPDKIWRFEWRIEAEPTFWHALLSTGAIRGRISGLASGTGGSMKNVAKAKLEAMPVPRIGIHRQREFALRSHQLVVARKRATAALAADDELFTSLQTRAFDGRL